MGVEWKRLALMYQAGTTAFETVFIYEKNVSVFSLSSVHVPKDMRSSSIPAICHFVSPTDWQTLKNPDIDRLTDGWTGSVTDGCIVWRQALGDIDRCICSLCFLTVNFIVYTVNQLTGQVLLLKTVFVSLTAHCQVDVVDDLRSLRYLDPCVSTYTVVRILNILVIVCLTLP